MDYKLEVVVLPVADVDLAKAFYKSLGWREDADLARTDDFRVVQLTPPGSACSVIFGTGVTSAAPGSAEGLQLVVDDVDAAREDLAARGATVERRVPRRDRRVPSRRIRKPGTGVSPRPPELRVIRLVQRPRREHMVRSGDHNPAARTLTAPFDQGVSA